MRGLVLRRGRSDLSHWRRGNSISAGVERRLFVLLNHNEDLLPIDRQLRWSLDANLDRITVDTQDFDDDAAINDDALIKLARKDKHVMND